MKAGTVIRYEGKRGKVWRIRYFDASGRRVLETLGHEPEWTRERAEAELRRRLVDVERDGWRAPGKVTFAEFAAEWLDGYCEAHALKRTTASSYRTIVNKHLIPAFRTQRLAEVDVIAIEKYVSRKLRAGASPRTVNSHLQVLGLICKAALKRRLIQANPVLLVDRPRQQQKEWHILTPSEIGAVDRAYGELIGDATDDLRRDDLIVSRAIFVVTIGVGLRRAETLGLRWRSVALADPDGPVLRVSETWTANRQDTPKSAAGRRTIALGERIASLLFEHRSWSAFDGNDELVFPNPRTGHPFDVHRHAELFRGALARAGVKGYVRPFHDSRHACLTHAAAAGTDPYALQTRAGHSSMQTTQRYVHLAGQLYREEAVKLEERIWGEKKAWSPVRRPFGPPTTNR
jgi:integrase